MFRLSMLYLFTYNCIQAIGWALSVSRILTSCASAKSVNVAFAAGGDLICFLQSLSFLEVFHGAIGIVPSGVLLPLMQWGGRTHFLLAIVCQIDEVQQLPSLFITFVAWGLSEIIRYPHHALNCIGICPSWITYLRYTAFIVLYPLGIACGEMWVMYRALPFIRKRNLFDDFFAGLPFNFYDFVYALLICYPFLWLKLYTHMFKQRRSKLGRHEKSKTI